MDALPHLLLVLAAASTAEGSVDPTCPHFDPESFLLLEGEGFYFVPLVFNIIRRPPDEQFTWYRNTSRVEKVSSDVDDRVHHQGAALFLLDLRPEDSGLYTAQQIDPSGSCRKFLLNVTVFKTSHKNNSELFYGTIRNSDDNKVIECPDPVRKTCDEFRGGVTWYRNFHLIQGEHETSLRVLQATKQDEGIYSCVCSWTYRNKAYESSASRFLRVTERGAGTRGVKILSPNLNEQFAEEGSRVTLNCTVHCGWKEQTCRSRWDLNGKPANAMPGYNQSTHVVAGGPELGSVSTAILTIHRVSADDFQTSFRCSGLGLHSVNSTTTRVKQRKRVVPAVVRGLCVLLLCLLAAVLVRCFAVDLALCLRPHFSVDGSKDPRLYDAYVVYPTRGLDKASEDSLHRFVSGALPSVLEGKCGYRLFIHGRDDKDGEDNLELAEERVKQSRRLMVVLTSGSETQEELAAKTPETGGFDWQAALQQTPVQRDEKVIVIQLEEPGPKANTSLCPDLQRVAHRSAPIRWREGSHGAAAWNSTFWKRVRYMMPAVPVNKYQHHSVV